MDEESQPGSEQPEATSVIVNYQSINPSPTSQLTTSTDGEIHSTSLI